MSPDDPPRRGQKVVAALTFRKHLSTLFPSGHHLNDDYCQLLVGHYRVLSRSLCRALAHVSARLPDPASTTRTKSWVTFLLGWQSQASAPRLSNVVRHTRKLVALCNVLLTQTQARCSAVCCSAVRLLHRHRRQWPFGCAGVRVCGQMVGGYPRIVQHGHHARFALLVLPCARSWLVSCWSAG